ncbi:MAG: MFS transporter [Candidatus Omnitrophica bacterium]|nr:MFS transporter [Candidatus Omnitrophota bacterium]
MLGLIFKNKNFRNLWTGQLISALGDRLTQMGILTFVMIAAQDKGDKMAMITFFSLLPFLIFGPLFGILADRYSRKNLMLIADLVRAVLVCFIPVIWINTHSVILIVAWFFLLGTFTALFTPAKMSIIGNITEKSFLLEANSAIVSTGLVATLVGTFIAGAVIKATGVKPAFFINGFTYVISALFILSISYSKDAVPKEIQPKLCFNLLSDIKTGVAYIKRHQLIMRLILLSSLFSLISSFGYILILNYSSAMLHQDSLGVGILLSAVGIGAILGSVILIKRKDKVNYGRALYLSYTIIGVFSLLFIFRPNFYFSILFLFCLGVGASMLTITLDTMFQRVTPDDLKGKIFSARGVFTEVVFLTSLLLVGVLIRNIQVTHLFAVIGIIGLITAIGAYFYRRSLRYILLRLWLKLMLKVLFNFKVSGLENIPKKKRYIFAANHTSIIDGIAVACAYPERIYFLAADSLFKTKFWGWWATQLGYLPVKRGGFNKEAIRDAVGILKGGDCIGIFPEGKISADGRLDEGKAGIALIARLADVDIVPCAIEGAYEAWPVPKRFPRRFPVEVRFSKPLDGRDYPVKEELLKEVMEEIAKTKLGLERDGYLRIEPDEIVKYLING